MEQKDEQEATRRAEVLNPVWISNGLVGGLQGGGGDKGGDS